MANFIQAPKTKANDVKKQLIKHNIYKKGIKTQSDSKYVYFPIVSKEIKIKELKKYKIVSKKAKTYTTTKSLRDLLVNRFKIKDYIASYDVVGNIAIIKVTKEMEPKEKEIAKAFLQNNKNIKTVVKKVSKHHGRYRIEDVKYLAGERTFKTQVKESNCVFNIELGKMFFSPRLSHERERCSKFIKPNSIVAVFFGGVGPFSIIIGKRNPTCKVYSIELNKKAHKYAIENIKLNKVGNVEPVCADVAKFAPKIKNKCDYIIMPLPKTSELFLEAAYTAIKKKPAGQITIYRFVPKKAPYDALIKKLAEFAKSKKKQLKIIFKRKVRDYNPKTVQIVINFKFTN